MIVIPMAGLSRRFTEAGYDKPKYMLPARGRSLFAHSVGSFAAYFKTRPFLFICRDVAGTPGFVAEECRCLGIHSTRCIVLDAPTTGQAETVALGLERAAVPAGEPVTVFNIDTFRQGFIFPTMADAADGYLEVFRGSGPNWSYVRPVTTASDRVAETAEKIPISDLCCTGLYHFRSASLYLSAYRDFAATGASRLGLKELYIAPMYNLLLQQGADIRYHLIAGTDVVFCGVPDEYNAFLATLGSLP
jgi:hypothetical protein